MTRGPNMKRRSRGRTGWPENNAHPGSVPSAWAKEKLRPGPHSARPRHSAEEILNVARCLRLRDDGNVRPLLTQPEEHCQQLGAGEALGILADKKNAGGGVGTGH